MNCKYIGDSTRTLEVTLAPNETFFAERGAMIYMDCGITADCQMNGSGLGSLISTSFSGESLLIMEYKNNSPSDKKLLVGGKYTSIANIKMEMGDLLFLRNGSYIASSQKVQQGFSVSLASLKSGMSMQQISGQGMVFFETFGTPICRDLASGECIEVDENHLAATFGISKDRMESNWNISNMFKGEGVSTMRIMGPGKVFFTPIAML